MNVMQISGWLNYYVKYSRKTWSFRWQLAIEFHSMMLDCVGPVANLKHVANILRDEIMHHRKDMKRARQL